MEDTIVRRGETARLERVEGELRVGKGARILPLRKGSDVVVTGGAHFEGDSNIASSFGCTSLEVKRGGVLVVDGDLSVRGRLDVTHSVEAKGEIRAGEVDVGGRVKSRSLECSGFVRVGGRIRVEDKLSAKSLDVGGEVICGGKVSLGDLNVGGVVEVGGGVISGKTRVGGKFVSSSPLEFGELQVFGQISLPSNCKGKKVSSYGRLSVEGDFTCGELEIRGHASIDGNCKSVSVESTGRLDVVGAFVGGSVVSTGDTKVSGELRCDDLKIAGSFGASKILVKNDLELLGRAEAKEGTWATSALVGSGSNLSGALVAKRVVVERSYGVVSNWGSKFAGQVAVFRLIGKETRVGDIYAGEVRLGRASRCGRVYAETVEFDEGCIMEEINYTRELRGPLDKVHLNRPFPRKVATLPDPPL